MCPCAFFLPIYLSFSYESLLFCCPFVSLCFFFRGAFFMCEHRKLFRPCRSNRCFSIVNSFDFNSFNIPSRNPLHFFPNVICLFSLSLASVAAFFPFYFIATCFMRTSKLDYTIPLYSSSARPFWLLFWGTWSVMKKEPRRTFKAHSHAFSHVYRTYCTCTCTRNVMWCDVCVSVCD